MKIHVSKPWGHYSDIYRPDDKKVVFKKIVVSAGEQLSHQYHKGRTEFWYIASGEGVMTIDDWETSVAEGDHMVIKPGEKHMVRNSGTGPLRIYEMQAGVCDEDDIVRLSDKYGR